jgi:hypothetical protein
MTTLDEHEVRIATLEVARSATSDALARLDRKVDRVAARVDALHHTTAELIAESEQRLRGEMTDLKAETAQLRTEIARVDHRVGASERRVIDILNERFDAVMVALDRLANPPKA